MARCQVPEYRSGKRKRAGHTSKSDHAIASAQSDLPVDATAFCRSPFERLQLSLAGLTDTDRDPTQGVKHFPHRALPPWYGLEPPHVKNKQPSKGKRRPEYGKHFHTLLQSIPQMLEEGDIARAEKAYTLLLQLRQRGKPVDVRRHYIWAMGAEILMRAGEKPLGLQDTGSGPAGRDRDEGLRALIPSQGFSKPTRWGFPGNIEKVKAYFETLIRRYPYDRRFPDSISALQFQLAMLRCEIYNAHMMSMPDLVEKEACTEHHPAEKHNEATSASHCGILVHQNDSQAELELRARALLTMQDITQRMDALVQVLPYHKNDDFLRLRATASLYTADLAATLRMTSGEQRSAMQQSIQLQRQVASIALEKLGHEGGDLNKQVPPGSLQNEEDLSSRSLHMSLPIRRI